MSIALMTDVWKLDIPTTDKMVLLALADAANDDGVCWTPVKSRRDDKLDLLTKCSLSERAVQGAIKRLCDGGLLSRSERPGRGVIYTVTPAACAPPQHVRPAANDVNPRSRCGETVSNLKPTSEANASSVGRARARHRFVPSDWEPNEAHVLKAQTLGLDLHEQAAAFRDFEFDKPKCDFDRAFHRWLRTARKFDNDRPANDRRTSAQPQPSRAERFQSAALEVLARRGALPGQGEGGGVHGGPTSRVDAA